MEHEHHNEHHKNRKYHDMDEKLPEVQINITYNYGIVTIKVRDKNDLCYRANYDNSWQSH